MDLKNVNKDKNIAKDEDLDWDEQDIEEVSRNLRVQKEKERKTLEKQKVVLVLENTEGDGNYFGSQPKVKNEKQQNTQLNPKSSVNNQNSHYVQPLSNKELKKIMKFTESTSTFHNLLYETYGHFDKYILTHETKQSDENIVELLNIDVALLSIPYDNHNMFLLKRICKIPDFWSQLIDFLHEFLQTKHKNSTFVLQVDMKTFFINLEIMFHKILVNDLMDSTMKKVFKDIIEILENIKSINEWAKPSRFLVIEAEYKTNKNVLKIYDAYPTLNELNCTEESTFLANVIDGEYRDSSHYLQVNLPLIKEDFLDLEDLKEGLIPIELIRSENIKNIFEHEYFMLEPTTYFANYSPVFNVLKNLNEVNFPFAEQILKVNDVDTFPTYRKSVNVIYNYQNLNFNVNKKNEWPSPEKLHLEPMQLNAIHKAVTSKFTIIQGPPGTGKTFVGLEILKMLLINTRETILVITQTNNALDKFLLGATKFTDNIVRLGRQSKCEELDRFNLKSEGIPLESKQYFNKITTERRREIEKFLTARTDKLLEDIRENVSRYNGMVEELNQLRTFCSIKNKRIIGMTTSYASKGNAILKMINAGIVIVEESSDVLESQIIASLTNQTKQLIMIGDHLQLRPYTNSYELTKKYHYNISLFERLIRNGLNYMTLDVQMRMSPNICNLVRSTIYPQLKDAPNVSNYPEVKGTEKSLFWFNHKFPESKYGGETSKENEIEANFVVQLCVYLVASGNNANDITILTVYAAQAERIKNRLKYYSKEIPTIRVAVLDTFQGEENKIILLSLVRSNNTNAIGFLSQNNRIAVVLSRAQFGFFIIGNMDCFAKTKNSWRTVVEILTEQNSTGNYFPIIYKNNVLKISTPEEFPAI
ncbi:unnamed protein product [Diamesa hyperborea]